MSKAKPENTIKHTQDGYDTVKIGRQDHNRIKNIAEREGKTQAQVVKELLLKEARENPTTENVSKVTSIKGQSILEMAAEANKNSEYMKSLCQFLTWAAEFGVDDDNSKYLIELQKRLSADIADYKSKANGLVKGRSLFEKLI